MTKPSVSQPHKQPQSKFGIPVGAVLVSLLLLCQIAMAGGTVGFNVKWYSTPAFPFVDESYPVTTGVVIADFNRDGIPDVAYSYPCCGPFGSSGGGVIVKLGTGGGNLGPDVPYLFGQDVLAELKSADINSDGWLDMMVPDVFHDTINVFLNNGDGTFYYAGIVGFGGTYSGSFTVGDFNHDGKMDVVGLYGPINTWYAISPRNNAWTVFNLGSFGNESVLRPLAAILVVNATLWFAALAASRVERPSPA